jgi:hypothetical protein
LTCACTLSQRSWYTADLKLKAFLVGQGPLHSRFAEGKPKEVERGSHATGLLKKRCENFMKQEGYSGRKHTTAWFRDQKGKGADGAKGKEGNDLRKGKGTDVRFREIIDKQMGEDSPFTFFGGGNGKNDKGRRGNKGKGKGGENENEDGNKGYVHDRLEGKTGGGGKVSKDGGKTGDALGVGGKQGWYIHNEAASSPSQCKDGILEFGVCTSKLLITFTYEEFVSIHNHT